MMLSISLLAITLGTAPQPQPPVDRWFAEDKLKHFFTTFVVSSLSASGARLAGADRTASLQIGIATGAGIGLMKEVRDRRGGGTFSYRDILWDVAGIAAAAALTDAAR